MSNYIVEVLDDVCQGYGRCAKRAGDYFRLNEEGKAERHGAEEVPANTAKKIAMTCPYRAIRVLDPESGNIVFPQTSN